MRRWSAAAPRPRPGEVSLAHHGVLFLDEMPEFSRHVLDVLRQPLEEGAVTIARAARTDVFPARFMLVGAMNPCPCGYLGDAVRRCRCTPQQVERYRSRLSGPLRDRLDLTVEVPALPPDVLALGSPRRASADVRARVVAARERQWQRYAQRRIPHQRAVDAGAAATRLRARPGRGAAPRHRGNEDGAQRARLRPHPQGRAHDCGPGRRRRRRRRPHCRGAAVSKRRVIALRFTEVRELETANSILLTKQNLTR